ncbi:MAG: tetratricopeptide repeat protein [Ignavibacteriae bacterium]|nr:tetratricopeptide repeat protein [Ignavibacteriota bacterium]NOG96845.1 tetratricopeptide repeat protein [Ignavibacteriota bacterium]
MQKVTRLLVLGDSVFSGFGNCFDNALDILCKNSSFSSRVQIQNLSAIGMTSADALLHFKAAVKKDNYDAAIIYLGNCDACGYGYLKPSVKFFPRKKISLTKNEAYRSKNPISIRNKPFKFTKYNISQNSLQSCVSIEDFKSNIARIIKHAQKNNIKLILINPSSKANFPPANNIGNFIFYKIVNAANCYPHWKEEKSSELIAAIKLQEEGRLNDALIHYKKNISKIEDGETKGIAKNNMAVILAEQENYSDAIKIIEEQLNSKTQITDIAAFNLAVILSIKGNDKEANKLFREIKERDKGTYRITQAYNKAIYDFSIQKTANVFYIGMDEFTSDEDFIDYCHPTDNGHKKLALKISGELKNILNLAEGKVKPELKYIPTNPDKYVSDKNFFEHFKIIAEPEIDFSNRVISEAEKKSYQEILNEIFNYELSNEVRIRNIILSHPLFGCTDFLKLSPPIKSVDQGQLPEFYFMRHMMPVYKMIENEERFYFIFNKDNDLLPNLKKINSWWFNLELFFEQADDNKLIDFALHYSDQIIKRTIELLKFNVSNEPIVFNKYRTITYWFFRESLIFGSASHYSMFFDRVSLFNIINTCLFMIYYLPAKSEKADVFIDIYNTVTELINIHKKHLLPHSDKIYLFREEEVKEYRNELDGFNKKIKVL